MSSNEEMLSEKKITSTSYDIAVEDLFLKWRMRKLRIDPEFQRKFIWDKKKASSLIESLILNLPVPSIFTSALNDEYEEVIDGQQRLTSIFMYIDGKWPTDNKTFRLYPEMPILSNEIGGKSFHELSKSYQEEIKNYKFRVVQINEDSCKDFKYQMFERLNTNIVKLTEQEIRNCAFRGPYNEFLKECACEPNFQYIINSPTKQKRMLDVELVLMFFAFYHNSLTSFISIKPFLDNEMRLRQNITLNDCIKLREVFRKSVSLTKDIWGKHAFNLYKSKTSTFNQGLYQVVMSGFTQYKKEQIIPYMDLIREEMYNMQVHNDEFYDACYAGTNSRTKVISKAKMWQETLDGILGYPINEPRAFSHALKDGMWRSNNTCGLCGQRIASVDDAELDHIVCYWRGGKTIPENAQLTHRICNRKKGGDKKNITKKNPDINKNKINEELREALLIYRLSNIEAKYDDIDSTILSDVLIDQIIKRKPTTAMDFYKIPMDYRQSINMGPIKNYIDDIVELVSIVTGKI